MDKKKVIQNFEYYFQMMITDPGLVSNNAAFIMMVLEQNKGLQPLVPSKFASLTKARNCIPKLTSIADYKSAFRK